MFRKMSISLLLVFCTLNACYASLAPFIKSCNLRDKDCLLTTNTQIAYPYLADGLPELQIPALEPLNYENVTMDQGYFKLFLPTLNVVGAKKCRVQEIKVDNEESSMKIVLDCPMVATGIYQFSGRVCVFKVDKNGDFKIQTDSMKTTINSKFETIEVDGKKYFKLLSYEYSSEPSRSMHIELADLFSGDVGKALPFLNAIDKDWTESVLTVGEPIASKIMKSVFECLKALFLNVSLQELEYS